LVGNLDRLHAPIAEDSGGASGSPPMGHALRRGGVLTAREASGDGMSVTTSRLDEIAEAAERLFSAQGYHATSVRQLAGAVNLQGGSLYAHFASKEDLLASIVDRAADEFHAKVEPVIRGPGAPVDRLRAAIRAHVGVIGRNPAGATVYFQDWRHLGEPRLAEVRARRDAYETLWRDLIREGVENGSLTPVDPRLSAIACLSMCNWLYQWYDPQGSLAPEEVGSTFADILLTGLARRAEAPPNQPPVPAPRRDAGSAPPTPTKERRTP
jgi:AcrR family transcriptional regulator